MIQIRDLDQTVIGNPAHDLIRLSLSLASAARRIATCPVSRRQEFWKSLIAGHQADYWRNILKPGTDKSYRPKTIQTLFARSTRRKLHHLAEERLGTVKPTIPLGKRF